ncbi:hypothetical protein LO772_30205 [Yinghuangia sp. ASG 101]|uniref:hypothetical protein n=1 Tax=Yinghuangia sp. ASG 101 TaxID=2896848 RepID=UPI001E2EFC6D|nr:hypothetical protein [Yinghuangia sp. ASG 101]UGQ11037.1 hypothetical protein LO772_30205 [Yinghuangia sp. ASG 101]
MNFRPWSPFTVSGAVNDASTFIGWIPLGVDPLEWTWNQPFSREGSKSEPVPVLTEQDRAFVGALQADRARMTQTPKFTK